MLFQEIVGQQSCLGRAATPEGHALPLEVCHGGDARVALGDQLGAEVDVDIPHCDDATGIVQALFDVDVRDRTIPGQVDFSGRKRFDERVIVGI